MENKVTFFLSADDSGNTEYMSARIVLPTGKEFHVGYHPNIGADGQRDGLNLGFNGVWINDSFVDSADTNSIWIEDKNPSDMFCSEMFAALTGRYPYEVEEWIEPNADYQPFPDNVE